MYLFGLTKKEFVKLLGLFGIWRILLFIISYFADYLLTYKPSFPYFNILDLTALPRWLYSWANFDGVHYLRIAETGYGQTALIQAFFPVYPYLLRLLSSSFKIQYLLAGVVLSNIMFVAVMILLFIYVKQRFSVELAWRTILLLLAFPTSFFFVSVYTESFFLMLCISAFLAARNKWWLWAGLFTMVASATRVIGIFLIPALAVEMFFQQYQITRQTTLIELVNKLILLVQREWHNLLLLLLGSIGLGGYMFYLWQNFQDPLYFFRVQSDFAAGREDGITLLPRVLFRAIKILLTARPIDLRYFSYVQEFVLAVFVLGLLFFAFVKRKYKIKISELVFSICAFILPTLTGTLSSIPRYILVCFPIYFLIPQLLKTRFKYVSFIFISLIFLVINTVLFIQGYWVA